ncbi:leucyl aminopeptidase family protein [Sporosarcina sp. YIM B06819]|uniref:M17 family metallopeptidase n=1 Tax=Sporosarcina sp. YIM B06819 TaxID=3081769 RepID=UPI00298D3FEC|nr:leucyl aminopeptidase family protein [Sporosarcina sp. YIM B06819]
MNTTLVPLNNSEADMGFIIHEEMVAFGEVTHIQVAGEMYVTVGVQKAKLTTEDIRFLGGKLRQALQKYARYTTATIDFGILHSSCNYLEIDEVVTAFVEGWHLGGYAFLTYKKEQPKKEVRLQFESATYEVAVKQGEIRAEAVSVARDLCNEPANKLTPAVYVDTLQQLFHQTAVSVEIIETDQLIARGFEPTAIVGAGSQYPPKVAILTLKNNDTKHIALVGKGVTFDSGGTNVKTGSNIGEMKMDMGGSAAVVGAMKLLADSNSPVYVTAILPLVTNVAGKDSYLPSDVLTYRNGLTVEVGNTDAEGRLVLADGILYAQEMGADTIIDIATLTGTIGQALGLKTAGIFSNQEDNLWSYKTLGEQTGDYVWPMPITSDYQTYIDSNTADVNNMSTSPFGGAITAAVFLQNFVEEDKKWIHIDMANTVRPWKEEGYYVTGAAGFGVRLLAEIVRSEISCIAGR